MFFPSSQNFFFIWNTNLIFLDFFVQIQNILIKKLDYWFFCIFQDNYFFYIMWWQEYNFVYKNEIIAPSHLKVKWLLPYSPEDMVFYLIFTHQLVSILMWQQELFFIYIQAPHSLSSPLPPPNKLISLFPYSPKDIVFYIIYMHASFNFDAATRIF